jgi:hypothetical protein
MIITRSVMMPMTTISSASVKPFDLFMFVPRMSDRQAHTGTAAPIWLD